MIRDDKREQGKHSNRTALISGMARKKLVCGLLSSRTLESTEPISVLVAKLFPKSAAVSSLRLAYP